MKILSRTKIHPHALLLVSMVLLMLTGTAWAYGRQGGPPQEAIDACAGKRAGAIVEFNGPRGGTVKGTCTERNGQLVAVPEGKGQRGGMRASS